MNDKIRIEEDFEISDFRLWGGYDLMSHSSEATRYAIIDLHKRIWDSQNEKSYEVTFSPKEILYSSFRDDMIRQFFKMDFINYVNPEEYNWEYTTDHNEITAELFIKLVWLCNILIEEGEFKYTIGTHFNPVFNRIVIHPGGTRQHALRLFPPKKVKSIHFDTLGNRSLMRSLKYNQSIKPIENYIEWCALNNYQVIFTPDHGTFIPHPMKGSNGIISGKKETLVKIKKVLENLNLKSNIPLPYINVYSKSSNTGICTVTRKFKDKEDRLTNLSEINLARILVLICLKKDWDCDSFNITWSEKII